MSDDLDKTWPYRERRHPHIWDPDYLGARGLSMFLQKMVRQELSGKTGLDVLDVGCGSKPFYPFLAPHAKSYLGTDVLKDNPMVDRVCPAEALDVESASIDVVLCLSVLEHVNDPIQSVRELWRVTRPGGTVFASTHGAFPWHPYPQDHWRWTQTGLPLHFRRHGGFDDVTLYATRGTMSGIFFLLAHYTWGFTASRRITRWMRKFATAAVNVSGRTIDRLTPGLRDVNRHVTAIPEFFVVARKQGA